MDAEDISDDDRRRKERFVLNLPALMNGDGYHDVEMVDISTTGLQIRTTNYDIFKGEGFVPDKKDQLKMCFSVKLAWAEPLSDGGFLTGWKFDMDSPEEQAAD